MRRENAANTGAKLSAETTRSKLAIGVLASGNGTNLQAIIDAIEANKLNAVIKIVISDKPGVYALKRAASHNIPVETVDKKLFASREVFDAEIVRLLQKHDVHLVVLAGFMRLLTPCFIASFRERIINIHPSLLPSFPGLDAQKRAIEHGAKFAGCTVHFVDEGLDSGPIIIQAVVPVLQDDTVETLSKRILAQEHRIYPEAIRLFAENRISVNGRRVLIRNARESVDAMTNPLVAVSD